MNKINCLIVDDEPIARDIIEAYCKHLGNLHVVASCGNALEAKVVLQQQKVDVLFLDINMPVMDGISFLKTLKKRPQVILTTAYREYGPDAFDLDACDYLLKPFSFDRFIIAVDKAIEKLGGQPDLVLPLSPAIADDFIFIKAEGKIFKIAYKDLLYAEANGNNTRIVTNQQILLPKMAFSNFEELLPESIFLRVHRSFIINKSKITHIEGNRAFINQTEIPIGNNYREVFLKALGF